MIKSIPKGAAIHQTVYKKTFKENSQLSRAQMKYLNDKMTKCTWIAAITPADGVRPYQDAERHYSDTVILAVDLDKDISLPNISDIIMRSIPHPTLIIYRHGEEEALAAAHQRDDKTKPDKNVLETIYCTAYQPALSQDIDLAACRYTHFYDYYSDIVDQVCRIIARQRHLAATEPDEIRRHLSQLDDLEKQIQRLQAQMKNEPAFNRQMEIHIQIQHYRKQIQSLLIPNK